MRIAVVHGYFLQGTGSNLLVTNLCRQLCSIGHEVQLFSQEPSPEKLDFVNQFTSFAADNRTSVTHFERVTDEPGACRCYRPNLEGKLPVYVYDNYEGYHVKTFLELTKEEIEAYIMKNQAALAAIWADKPPDLILSNHTIMQPVYVHRALREIGSNPPHFVTIHGSCLNFAVRKSALLQEYAREAIAGVTGLVFVSQFSKNEFSEFFAHSPDIDAKSRIIPAGVDIDRFQPLESTEEKTAHMSLVTAYLRQEGVVREPTYAIPLLDDDPPSQQPEGRDMWLPDVNAADRIESIDWLKSKLVVYYGKYLWTKGVQLLIGAAPLVLAEHPETWFALVGFGSFRPYLEKMVAALHQGREDIFRSMVANTGVWYPEAGPAAAGYFGALIRQLDDAGFAREYFGAAKGTIGNRVIFTGFVPHDYLREIIACAEIAVAPSIFPEAFGLVGVEALASGVIPLQTNHTGFSEVIQKYTRGLRELFQQSGQKPLLLDEQLALNLAGNLNRFLDHYSSIDQQQRQDLRRRTRAIALEYSWSNMVQQYLHLITDDA